MPKCSHIVKGAHGQEYLMCSTHGRCLLCGAQLFTSKVLNRAGIPEYCEIARRFGRLKDPEYARIERREYA